MNLTQTVKSVTLTVATHLEDAGKLEAEWNVLWQTCGNTTPFQSPAWLLPYLHVFKPGRFKVLSIRRRERLIAVIPITIVRSGGQAVLRLLGQEVSDYMDGLCVEEDRVEVYSLIKNGWLTSLPAVNSQSLSNCNRMLCYVRCRLPALFMRRFAQGRLVQPFTCNNWIRAQCCL